MSLVLTLGLFAALTLFYVSADGLLLKAAVGNTWTVGPRDTEADRGPLAGRARRALSNFTETAPAFVALAVAGASLPPDRLWEAGALAYLAGRAAYLPAYLSGLPWLRTGLWWVASGGLLAMLASLAV